MAADKKAADRTFVIDGRARPAKANNGAVVPALGGVQRKGAGSPMTDGMGMSADARARLMNHLKPVPIEKLLSGNVGCDDPELAAVDCSTPAFRGSGAEEYLRVNALNNGIATPTQRSGFVNFNNAVGPHDLWIGEGGDVIPIEVGAQQTFLITNFAAFAGMSNPGLPGSYVEIDMLGLVGLVAFYLQADNGAHPYPENTSAGNAPMGNGTELVNVPSVVTSPSFTDTAVTNFRAVYEVLRSPFPGFPAIVGAKVRGYMLPRQLFYEALTACGPDL